MTHSTSQDATSTTHSVSKDFADTIVPVEATQQAARALNVIDRFARRGVMRHFNELHDGTLSVTDSTGQHVFGRAIAEGLAGRMSITSPEFFRRLAFSGSIGFAESYILGEWSTDDLLSVLRVLTRNIDIADKAEGGLASWLMRLARRWHERHSNTKDGSAKNIHAHYDLGNDFYALFLDETMTYSAGIFETSDSTLDEASVAKVDRLCRKLDLKPTDHLLEIGTGWGYFAVHAARNYGCKVTTTTISREHFDFARRRVEQAGLSDRITLLLEDYRNLTGQFDKLVSVEMIEAVGYEYFDTFFRQCGQLLKPDGQMALQGISMSEQRYPAYLKSVEFIQRYIFPGGCLITPSSVMASVARTTDMRLLHLEDLAPHYARTLRMWRERFFARIDDVRALGFPESFIRLWEYYLCYCEAAFEERLVGTVQMHFAKPRCTTDALRPVLLSDSSNGEPKATVWQYADAFGLPLNDSVATAR